MKYYVYILRCSDTTLYTSYTDDVEKRLALHNEGKISKYTSTRLPCELVFKKEYSTKHTAMMDAYIIKQLPKDQKEALVRGNKGD